jgi:hypothetical protein
VAHVASFRDCEYVPLDDVVRVVSLHDVAYARRLLVMSVFVDPLELKHLVAVELLVLAHLVAVELLVLDFVAVELLVLAHLVAVELLVLDFVAVESLVLEHLVAVEVLVLEQLVAADRLVLVLFEVVH